MFKNTTGQYLTVIAFADAGHASLDAGELVTGDAANITCEVEQDDDGTQSATDDVNPTEVKKGQYRFLLTQAESNGDKLTFYPESSTAGVQVMVMPSNVMYTRPPNFADLGIESDGDLTKVNALDGHIVQTGDSYAIVNSGTHGNAALKSLIDTIDTVVDAVKTNTDDLADGERLDLLIDAIKAKTDNLKASWNDISQAEANAACDTALTDYDAVVPGDLPANFGVMGINASGHLGRVTLVDTTTTNTDMRGTDGASTFDAGSDTVTVGTNSDKTGYSLSAAGVQAIWDALTSALTTAGSVGKRISDYLNAAITSRSSHSAADVTGGTTVAEAVTHGNANWTTATGFSTHSAADVTGGTTVAAAVTHGDSNWATATGFATHTAADVKTAIEANGSKLDHIWETTEDDGGTRRFSTNALEQAPSGSTAVTVTPLSSQTSATGGVTKSYLTGYQHAKLGTWIIAITDADGDALDLSGRNLAMCFWPAKTSPASPSFVLANYDGATDITIGGASNNQLTITGDDAYTETAGAYDWVVRDQTNDRVLAEGQLTIKTAADAT